MKILIKSSFVLTVFSLTIILFQIACEDEASANISGQNLTQQNKLLYVIESEQSYTIDKIQLLDLDGTSVVDVPMTNLPQVDMYWESVRITPDGKTIIISGYEYPANINKVFTMKTDGTDVKKIYEQSLSANDLRRGSVVQAY